MADEGDLDIEDLIAEEDVIISVSRAGYVKRLPVDAFKRQLRGGKGVRGQNLKEEDVVKHVFTTTTHNWMLFFTTKGRVYRVKAHSIPESGRTARGLYAANLPGVALDGDERISAVIDLKEYSEGEYLLFATKNGIVKKTKLPEYDSPRTGLIAINLREGDELIDVKLTEGKDEIFLVSRRGQAIRFKESLARPMGRGTAGVIGMRLGEDDRVIAVGLASEGEEMISVTEQGYGKRSKLADYPPKGRGGKGVIGHQLTKKTGLLAGAYIGTKDIDMFVISSSGQVRARAGRRHPPGRPGQPGRAHDARRGGRDGRGARPGDHPDGRGRGASVFGQRHAPEHPPEQQVVDALQRARHHERRAERHVRHQRRADDRSERPGHVPGGVREGRGGRPFLGVDHRRDVGLAGGHVHLRQDEPQQQHRDRPTERRHQRDRGSAGRSTGDARTPSC